MPLDERGGANLRTYATRTFQGKCSSVKVPFDGDKYYCFEHSGDYSTGATGGWNGYGGIGLHGTTAPGNIMNPYITVYMWRRIS